ncbi:MAG TPA: amidohydrolase family protein [Longimicrobiaceae bacterium]|nr:amidohydrolase family protein [Longimicrobiaceae bacterium]
MKVLSPVLMLMPALVLVPGHAPAQPPPPILDMHLHARDAPDPERELPPKLCLPVTVYGVVDPQCAEPLVAPATDEAMVERTVEILERRNVIGVISDDSLETVRRFRAAAPDRLIPAYELDLDGENDLSPEEFRKHFEAGDFQVLGEIAIQYEGIAPDDERMEPYWELAEEIDIPVALHLGEGYPGAPYLGSPGYRVRLGSPLLLEEVLVRHPDLRLYVMHYGSPLVDEMIAVMYTYPNVYVDVGSNVWHYPRAYFYSQLTELLDAGFGKRILFGSDQMLWPELIEISIDVIEDAPFLSEEQKRDILYNNAARFLRLSEEEIARHHGPPIEREDQVRDES